MTETNYISSIQISDGKRYDIKDTYARKRMTEITWSSLVSLRNSKQLIPGMQYRITDYHTTTSQKNTKSVDHQFDIIVTADSTDTLNESARAIQHVGDTYFSNCNLAAWNIWYCLDNDTKRFHWAGSTNGKGVIYRMIDEHNNDCPYDFKNIQFVRYYSASTNSLYGYAYMCCSKDQKDTDTNDITNVDTTKSKYLYTFSYDDNSSISDASIGLKEDCSGNVIYSTYRSITIDNTKKYNNQYLNNIIIIIFNKGNTYLGVHGNKFGMNCRNCTIYNCTNNTFGNGCWDIMFGANCDCNTISERCYRISFAHSCVYNFIGNDCYFVYLAGDCYKNNFSDCSTFTSHNSLNSCIFYTVENTHINYKNQKSDTNNEFNYITVYSLGNREDSELIELYDYLKHNYLCPQFVGINSSGTIVSYTLDSIINNS